MASARFNVVFALLVGSVFMTNAAPAPALPPPASAPALPTPAPAIPAPVATTPPPAIPAGVALTTEPIPASVTGTPTPAPPDQAAQPCAKAPVPVPKAAAAVALGGAQGLVNLATFLPAQTLNLVRKVAVPVLDTSLAIPVSLLGELSKLPGGLQAGGEWIAKSLPQVDVTHNKFINISKASGVPKQVSAFIQTTISHGPAMPAALKPNNLARHFDNLTRFLGARATVAPTAPLPTTPAPAAAQPTTTAAPPAALPGAPLPAAAPVPAPAPPAAAPVPAPAPPAVELAAPVPPTTAPPATALPTTDVPAAIEALVTGLPILTTEVDPETNAI